ncbi:MAG: hypothetical protein J6U83_05785 [Bacteroidales bacterium]|nr:hypothetical protein [Bacteroidales bacterium]
MRKHILMIACMALMLAACGNPSKMAKLAEMVNTECTPEVLEAVNGKIAAQYSVEFPAKYFVSEAILDITPVMVYAGGEVAGPVFTLQGDKVMDNNNVISYKNGGKASRAVVFDYKPGMEKAVLELRATVYNSKKTKKYEFPINYKVADGTNCTYMLVKLEGTPSMEADNYQKIIRETKESQILYTINQSNVRNNQLKSEQMKEFQEFLSAADKDERRTIVSNDIIAYASPDGAETLNNKLSQNRAKSAEKAFVKVISKKAKVKDIPLNISEISEDWEGFQELVSASDIQDKELILRVLSMYSDPVVREREIKNMSAVFQTLAKEVLPALRRSRLIANVDYKNWTDEELTQLINDNINELDEEALLYGATLFDKASAKAEIYKAAAKNYNSSRAYNNLAAMSLKEGKTADAKAYLAKMNNKTASYYNNMAVVAMQEGNFDAAAENLAKAGDLKQAKENMGALLILKGDYNGAVAALNGANSFNEALANVLTNNLSKASSILANAKCPCKSYLKAIIAARQGNNSQAKELLEVAKKDEKLAKRAANDIEFAKL